MEQVEQDILKKMDTAFNIDLLEKIRFSLDEYDEKQLVDIMVRNKIPHWKYKDLKMIDGKKTYKKYLVAFKGGGK